MFHVCNDNDELNLTEPSDPVSELITFRQAEREG